MVWYFIGVCIINRTLHRRLEKTKFLFLCIIFFNTRKEILYLRATKQYPVFLFLNLDMDNSIRTMVLFPLIYYMKCKNLRLVYITNFL